MTKLFLLISLFLLVFCRPSWAEDLGTHSAYKVTSYNLGTIVDDQNRSVSHYVTDFNPLLITSTTSDVLQNEHVGRVFLGDTATSSTNARGVALSATFDATKKISLQGAFGVTRNLLVPESLKYENESSWEANLGVIYRLLGNVSYELHFGYMDTGTLFNDRSSYTNVESIIMISNQLTMSF